MAPSELESAKVVEEVIRRRRSIRVFEPGTIPSEHIEHCLDMAMLAPNSSNLQAWEFYWIQSPEVRKKAVEACFSQAAAATANELIAFIARTRTWRRIVTHNAEVLSALEKQGARIPEALWTYTRKIIPFTYSNGVLGLKGLLKKVLFFVMGLVRPSPRGPTTESDLRLWAHKTVALAAENFMLAAGSLGYDTCPMEGFDPKRLHRALNLPRDARITMVVAVGRRRPSVSVLPQIRAPRDWFVHRV